MSNSNSIKRFEQSGRDVVDNEQVRVAMFSTEREAAEAVEFLNGGATSNQVEAYVWETDK